MSLIVSRFGSSASASEIGRPMDQITFVSAMDRRHIRRDPRDRMRRGHGFSPVT